MKLTKFPLLVALILGIGGCATPNQQPPVTPNFVFTPTSSAPAKNGMSIAILRPGSKGGFLETNRADLRPVINDFLNAYRTDLEKIILAKGFTTAGAYAAFDEMTFSQKERSALILRPEVAFNITTQTGVLGADSTAIATGTVTIEFLEPMSKEKVWIKRFELPPTTQKVEMAVLRTSDGRLATNPDGTLRLGLTANSATALLNSFYAAAFSRIYEQIDSREILALKSDAEKLKRRTNYRAN